MIMLPKASENINPPTISIFVSHEDSVCSLERDKWSVKISKWYTSYDDVIANAIAVTAHFLALEQEGCDNYMAAFKSKRGNLLFGDFRKTTQV